MFGDKLTIGPASTLEAEFEWVYTVHSPNGSRSWRAGASRIEAEDKLSELRSLALQAGLEGDYTITRRKRLTAIYLGEEEEV